MSEAMADQHSDDGNTARMTVETYRQVWRQVRAAAVDEANTISKNSKMSLREQIEMSEKNTQSKSMTQKARHSNGYKILTGGRYRI